MHSPPSNDRPPADGSVASCAHSLRRKDVVSAACLALSIALWLPSCGSDPAPIRTETDPSLLSAQVEQRSHRVESLEQLKTRLPEGLRGPLERSVDKAVSDYKATWSQVPDESNGVAVSEVLKRSRLLTKIIDRTPALLDAEQELDTLLASPWASSRDWRPDELALECRNLKAQALSALEAMRIANAADLFEASADSAELVHSQLLSLQELSRQQDAIDETVAELQRLGLVTEHEAQFHFCSEGLIDSLIERPEAVDETLSSALARASTCQLILARSLDSGRKLRRLESIEPRTPELGVLLDATVDTWEGAIVRTIDSASNPASDPTAASPGFLEERVELTRLWSALWEALDHRAVLLADAQGFIGELDEAVGPLPDRTARLEQAEQHAWLYPDGWEVTALAERDEHQLATEIMAPQIDVTFVLIGVFPTDRFHMKAGGPDSQGGARSAMYLAKYPITVAVWQQHLGRTGGRTAGSCHTALTLAPGDPTETWVVDPEATFLDPLPQLRFTASAETPATLICWSSARAFCASYGFALPTTSLWREGLRKSASPIVEASSPRGAHGQLTSVSTGQADGAGLKNMGTIVREWCAPDAPTDANSPPSTRRPLMGGSWRLAEQSPSGSLARGDFAGPTVGFRPALVVPLEQLTNPKLPTSEQPR